MDAWCTLLILMWGRKFSVSLLQRYLREDKQLQVGKMKRWHFTGIIREEEEEVDSFILSFTKGSAVLSGSSASTCSLSTTWSGLLESESRIGKGCLIRNIYVALADEFQIPQSRTFKKMNHSISEPFIEAPLSLKCHHVCSHTVTLELSNARSLSCYLFSLQ